MDKYLFLLEEGSCWLHFCATMGSAGLLHKWGEIWEFALFRMQEVKATRENVLFQSPLCHRPSECTCTCLISLETALLASVELLHDTQHMDVLPLKTHTVRDATTKSKLFNCFLRSSYDWQMSHQKWQLTGSRMTLQVSDGCQESSFKTDLISFFYFLTLFT